MILRPDSWPTVSEEPSDLDQPDSVEEGEEIQSLSSEGVMLTIESNSLGRVSGKEERKGEVGGSVLDDGGVVLDHFEGC